MKPRSIAILAALAAMILSVAVASPANKRTVTLSEPAIVGSVTLQPGEYIVEWNGTGPDVQVSFSREKKAIVTVPATLEAAQNPHDLSIVSEHIEESEVHSLVEIRTKTWTLRFVPLDASGGK